MFHVEHASAVRSPGQSTGSVKRKQERPISLFAARKLLGKAILWCLALDGANAGGKFYNGSRAMSHEASADVATNGYGLRAVETSLAFDDVAVRAVLKVCRCEECLPVTRRSLPCKEDFSPLAEL
jgi:hypothetical protein